MLTIITLSVVILLSPYLLQLVKGMAVFSAGLLVFTITYIPTIVLVYLAYRGYFK